MISSSYSQKNRSILDLFSNCISKEQVYDQIIALGRKQESFDSHPFAETHLVKGCQSQLYLVTTLIEGKAFFKTYSEALISAGLAQLLIWFYNGETPESILTTPPAFLDELKIPNALTPNRANGLYSLHLRMKQDALKLLIGANSLERS